MRRPAAAFVVGAAALLIGIAHARGEGLARPVELRDPDGKAHALPSMLPFKGHFAINGDTVALALGTGSESTASDLLGDKPAASPLWFMVFDYARLGQIMPQGAGADPDFEMFKLFGIGTFQAGVDDRGLFGWFSIEVK